MQGHDGATTIHIQHIHKMLATIESKQRIEHVHSFNSSVIMNIFIVKNWGEIIKMKTLNIILRDKSYSESFWSPSWSG